MSKQELMSRYTVEEPRTMKSETDWARVKATTESEIEMHALEDEYEFPENWKDVVILSGRQPKKDVHIRLDLDVLEWFRRQGPGYQTRINAVLKSFVKANTSAGVG